MRVALIVGQSNVGKTLLMIRLAESFGIKLIRLELLLCKLSDHRSPVTLGVNKAVETLTGPALNQTRSLQGVPVPVAMRKGLKPCRLVDSVGLSDRIHPDARIRKGMADTLRELVRARVILHVVDSERIALKGVRGGFGEIDYQVMQYGSTKGGYAMVVNKTDVTGGQRAVAELRREFPRIKMIATSAKTGFGLDETRRFVQMNL